MANGNLLRSSGKDMAYLRLQDYAAPLHSTTRISCVNHSTFLTRAPTTRSRSIPGSSKKPTAESFK